MKSANLIVLSLGLVAGIYSTNLFDENQFFQTEILQDPKKTLIDSEIIVDDIILEKIDITVLKTELSGKAYDLIGRQNKCDVIPYSLNKNPKNAIISSISEKNEKEKYGVETVGVYILTEGIFYVEKCGKTLVQKNVNGAVWLKKNHFENISEQYNKEINTNIKTNVKTSGIIQNNYNFVEVSDGK